jgi:HAMP domain-containing protein
MKNRMWLVGLVSLLMLGLVASVNAETYTINLSTDMDEVEAGMMSRITATCLDSFNVCHNASVTFTVDGALFTWDNANDEYRSIVMKSVPQTVTFDNLDSFHDAGDVSSTASVNATVTVIWLDNRLDDLITTAATGDLPGMLWGMTIYEIGGVFVYTFIALGVSVAIYNYSGPYPVMIAWLLMWGAWSSVVHGTAAEIGIALMVLGGGTLIAKLYLDRRDTGQ